MSIVDYRSALMLAIYFVVAVDLHTVQVPVKWVMNKFLKDSKPMNSGLLGDALSDVLWSTKPGGFRRAITEFKSFNPKNMKRTRDGYGVEGTIGDLRVSVEREGPGKRRATVTIKNKKTYKTSNVIWYE